PKRAGGLRNAKGSARTSRENAAQLPATDYAIKDAVHIFSKRAVPSQRKLVIETDDEPLRHVEPRERTLITEIEVVLDARSAGHPLHVRSGNIRIADHLGNCVVSDYAQTL